MIERKDVLSFSFYKLEAFTGSDGNMRYRIEKAEEIVPSADGQEIEEGQEEKETYLRTTIWPGPYCYTATDPSLYIVHRSNFSEEGICEAVDWMNSEHHIFE